MNTSIHGNWKAGMRTETYSLEIICDASDCDITGMRFADYFDGEDQNHVYDQAKAAGWHLGDEDLCPQCAREKDGTG